jgi:Rieske Fe-S protein
MAEDQLESAEEVGRRKFLTGVIAAVAGTVGVVVGVPAVAYLISPGVKVQNQDTWLTLGPVSSLVPDVPTGFPYAVRIKDGWETASQTGVAFAVTHDGVNVRVYSNICTHLSCRVNWNPDKNGFFCPCHDGLFNIDGQVVAGPPPRPLDEFQSKIENGQIMILLEA